MNLIIDQGNTLCKIACIEPSGNISFSSVFEKLTPEIVKDLIQTHQPEYGILANVKKVDAPVLELLDASLKTFVVLGPDTPLPIRNGYATPETLGFDRLAAAVGAWSIQPGKPLLVIDLGTAVTYDFVSQDGVYTGGNIAPGLRTRLKSLNDHTSTLPLVEPLTEFDLLGISTETAIRSGVMQGLLFEINGYIDALKLQYPSLFAFLTGGDLIYFDGKLKNGIFVDANLVLTGLNRILRHNVHS
jgi:type III pantothenate kinase